MVRMNPDKYKELMVKHAKLSKELEEARAELEELKKNHKFALKQLLKEQQTIRRVREIIPPKGDTITLKMAMAIIDSIEKAVGE